MAEEAQSRSNGRPDRIVICDVGPRDGLQNESRALSPTIRAELCNRLARAGLPRVEAVSFVDPRRVPQMAGAEEVVAGLDRGAATAFAGLVLNERGYERALSSGVEEIHFAFPVTDTFCARNQGTTLQRAVALAGRLVDRAREDGLKITVTLGASFGCPFEGRVEPERVVALAAQVQAHGPDEIVLADTIGVGVPSQVRALVSELDALGATIGCHFHNTRNTGFTNALAAVEAGVRLLDASCGGCGGCPFAPGASGNIATEDLVYLLHGMGYPTGVDLAAVLDTASWLSGALGKELPGQTYRVGSFAPVAA